MKTISKILTQLSIIFLCINYWGQTACFNADFEDNTFTNWIGYSGTCCGINTPNIGITNQHSIMIGPGFDPVVSACYNLSIVPPGSNFSARVGDGTGVNAQAARLQYNFTISPQSNMIIVKYAVVLEDPLHSVSQQPRFEAQLFDQGGNPIPCTFYQVAASSGVPGFQSCGSIRYKDWTTFGVDVSNYIGQQITLDVATGDCSLGGHFGYAYVSAECTTLNLSALYCENGGSNSATLTAPDGFSNYVWTDPITGQQLGTGQVVTIQNITQDSVNCTITSANGCVATLTTEVLPAEVIGQITDTNVCFGYPSVIFNNTTTSNATLDSVYWSSSDGYSDTTFNFNHVFPNPGQWIVEMIAQNSEGCIDTVSTTIEVFENPVADFSFLDVCLGQQVDLISQSQISNLDTITNFWFIQSDTLIGDSVVYNFPGPDVYNINLLSITQNGCIDTMSQQVIVYNNPVANFSIEEACIDEIVTFINQSQIDTTWQSTPQWQWWNSGNLLDTTFNWSGIFMTPGNNQITLYVVDSFSQQVQCQDSITLNFFVHDYPQFSYIADTIQCEGVQFLFTTTNTISTSENLNHFWQIDGVNYSDTTWILTTQNTPGVYDFTYGVTTDFGCQTDTTFSVNVMQTPEPPVLDFTTPECPGDPFFLSATGEANSEIVWSGPNNFSSTLFNVNFPLGVEGMGWYGAYLISEWGCISDLSEIDATITYIKDFNDFDFPNVISANSDGTNDFLDLKSYFETCDDFTLQVFNRWGNLVWEQAQSTQFFSGKDLNGKDLLEGIYFWKLIFDEGEKSGFIHIVR